MRNLPRAVHRRVLVLLLVSLGCILAVGVPRAYASTNALGQAAAATPGALSPLPSNIAYWRGNRHIAGHRLTPRQAIALAAERSAKVNSYWRAHPGLTPAALPTRSGADATWAVSWLSGSTTGIVAVLNERGDRVIAAWTGTQAEWSLARGYPWYSGNVLRKWFVWLPLCLLFLFPFLDRRRPFRILHFDLLALLALSVSFFLFGAGRISASVPLVYPVLVYLLGRMLWVAFRPTARRERLIPHVRASWLVAGIVVLMLLRIGATLADSTALDVGAAGVAGAHQLIHGGSLYDGSLGRIIIGGDTYGPVNYLAYVPFAALFHHDLPWLASGGAGVYTHHPSTELPTLVFDLLTLVGLILLGRRLIRGSEGKMLGLALGYAWVSYPFTALVLQENTNDSLVAALIVFSLLALAYPRRRGVMLAFAALTKFFPVILLPLLATGSGPRRMRSWITVAVAFGLAACALVLPFVSPGALRDFYHHTVGAQLHRSSPFSLWGQHSKLHPLQIALEAGTVLLATGLAFVPRVRTTAQVAALAAALVLAFEICLSYWYYTYIVWFAPLVFAALFVRHGMATWPSGRHLSEPDIEQQALGSPVLELVA